MWLRLPRPPPLAASFTPAAGRRSTTVTPWGGLRLAATRAAIRPAGPAPTISKDAAMVMFGKMLSGDRQLALQYGFQRAVLSPFGQDLIGGLAQGIAAAAKAPGQFFAGKQGGRND